MLARHGGFLCLGTREEAAVPPHLVVPSHSSPIIWENSKPFGASSWLGGGAGTLAVCLPPGLTWMLHPSLGTTLRPLGKKLQVPRASDFRLLLKVTGVLGLFLGRVFACVGAGGVDAAE